MKLVDFAKERGVDSRTIHKYMERYPEIRNDCKKDGKNLIMGDYALRELDKVYPLPKPVVVINGLNPDEERKLREDLDNAQKAIIMLQNELTDHKLFLMEKEQGIALLEERKEHTEEKNKALEAENGDLKAQNEELQEKLRKMENRSFLERIFNKGV